MDRRIAAEEIKRMRQLAALGNATDEATDPAAGLDELELIHLDDVVDMQRLLAVAANELDRLYGAPES
jgi:hypothetical protein